MCFQSCDEQHARFASLPDALMETVYAWIMGKLCCLLADETIHVLEPLSHSQFARNARGLHDPPHIFTHRKVGPATTIRQRQLAGSSPAPHMSQHAQLGCERLETP